MVFHSGQQPNPGLALHDFHTHYCALREDNVAAALHASGAIPFVLTGERISPEHCQANTGMGGIIDYHFDLGQYRAMDLFFTPTSAPA